MKLNFNQILALVYADLFDWPLSLKEADKWQTDGGLRTIEWKKDGYGRLAGSEKGFLFIRGRKGLVARRKKREKWSGIKRRKAEKMARLLGKIRWIEAVFLTGSVAAGSADEGGDIDLMIICRRRRVWLTRMVVSIFLAVMGMRRGRSGKSFRDKFCTNIFLTNEDLAVPAEDLYTAHEILQASCIYDRGGVERQFLVSNRWARRFLPVAFVQRMKMAGKMNNSDVVARQNKLFQDAGDVLEGVVYWAQYQYMKQRITREKIGKNYAYFHPRDLSGEVAEKFSARLAVLGIIKSDDES